jgi:aryl-alcohol dehydrogenase-like predicted oxidoreductase
MTRTPLLGDKRVKPLRLRCHAARPRRGLWPPCDPDAARAVLRRAVELGVDHIDTAEYDGPDVVNGLIREALRPYPESLKLVTKVGGRRDDTGAWLMVVTDHAPRRAATESHDRAMTRFRHASAFRFAAFG